MANRKFDYRLLASRKP